MAIAPQLKTIFRSLTTLVGHCKAYIVVHACQIIDLQGTLAPAMTVNMCCILESLKKFSRT
tara:strand:+ start:290 stop:472 length:183 start_codon:yes stop_codon:yes gene_type:complete